MGLRGGGGVDGGGVGARRAGATIAATAQWHLLINPPHVFQSCGEDNVRPPDYTSIPEIGIRVTAEFTNELRCAPGQAASICGLHSMQPQATLVVATCLHPAIRVPGHGSLANCFYGRRRPTSRLARIR